MRCIACKCNVGEDETADSEREKLWSPPEIVADKNVNLTFPLRQCLVSFKV